MVPIIKRDYFRGDKPPKIRPAFVVNPSAVQRHGNLGDNILRVDKRNSRLRSISIKVRIREFDVLIVGRIDLRREVGPSRDIGQLKV